MEERYTELYVSFSTADTRPGIELICRDSRLSITFRQSCGTKTQVVFEQVAAFRWDDRAFARCTVSPDRVYQVEGSSWLAEFHGGGGIARRVHFRLYFNSDGSALDVIAAEMNAVPVESS